MTQLVVLLRGINVGKAKQVPMADLRELLDEAGFTDVRTHLRSGNVLLRGKAAPAKAAAAISDLLAEHFGFQVDVVVRTAEELAAIIAANPFADVATDPSRQLVAFLSGEPDAEALVKLADGVENPDQLAVRERELHLWCPDGFAESPLSKAFGRAKLGVTVTGRNWRTVVKLDELAREG